MRSSWQNAVKYDELLKFSTVTPLKRQMGASSNVRATELSV